MRFTPDDPSVRGEKRADSEKSLSLTREAREAREASSSLFNHHHHQCHSISHGCCSNFFAGTTLAFSLSFFVLLRISSASSPSPEP